MIKLLNMALYEQHVLELMDTLYQLIEKQNSSFVPVIATLYYRLLVKRSFPDRIISSHVKSKCKLNSF